ATHADAPGMACARRSGGRSGRQFVRPPAQCAPEGALRFTFDPNQVFPLGSDGNVYPGGTFSGEWGSLEVTTGDALVAPDFSTVRVPLDGLDRDWKLTLADGWQTVVAGSGMRLEKPGR